MLCVIVAACAMSGVKTCLHLCRAKFPEGSSHEGECWFKRAKPASRVPLSTEFKVRKWDNLCAVGFCS